VSHNTAFAESAGHAVRIFADRRAAAPAPAGNQQALARSDRLPAAHRPAQSVPPWLFLQGINSHAPSPLGFARHMNRAGYDAILAILAMV
jgi:hypothetical protein